MSMPVAFRMRRSLSLLLAAVLAAATLLSALPAPAHAYVSALGNVIAHSVSGDTLTLTVDNGAEPNDDILIFDVLQDDIVKVSYRPNNVSPSPDTPMIDPDKTWSAVGAAIDTSGNPITITTAKMKVEIAKSPARVTIKKADGTTLLWEPASGGVFHDGVRFQHASGHNIYGIRSYNANESAPDLTRNNSNHPAHAGHQGDSGGPLMWSTAGYGILVDSDGGYPYTDDAGGKLEFYYGGTPEEGRRYSKTDVEYYAIVGEPKEIMAGVAEITGKSPMLPKWSLGFMNFEWGMNQAEMTAMIDTYRAKNIPLDGYGLDYDWKKYGETNYGEFAWNGANFPDADSGALKSEMDAKGVKMIGITKPRIVTMDAGGNRTSQYYDAESGGYWYPGHSEYSDYFIPVLVRSIDPYNAAMRSWYWQHSEDAYDKGIVGWWNDETDKVSSGAAQWWFGNFSTTHLSQAMYEGQRAYTGDAQRVWQTARTFYPGAQRYATTLWSGDIGAQFHMGEKVDWASGMQEQRTVMLSSVNNGQPKWGMDAGGFNPADSNPSPELYARWLQFAALTPVFRVHGNLNHQRQPWYYGNTAEEAAKSAIQLRYSLVPYMYAYEREAYETGLGLVRPLLFDYPNDPIAANYTQAWMFGDWLLAAPVVDPSQTAKDIYLPAGTWIDYFRGTVHAGGQTIKYDVNAETWSDIPLFVKRGAIIPTQKPQDYIGQSAAETIEVDVFADTSASSFTYYEDDNTSYDYEDGEHFKQTMTAQDNGGGISFQIAARSGAYAPEAQHYLVKIHGKAGTGVTLGGGALASYADPAALRAAGGEGWTTGRDVYGPVTYVKVAAGSASAKNIVVSGDAAVGATATKLEAEDASLSGNTIAAKAKANDNHGGYSGTGFADGFDSPGAAVTFYADVRTGGDYNVDLRYANATGAAKTLSIYVNGERIKATSLPNLTNWSTWSTQSETLPLAAGRNAVTYKYDSDAGDTGNVNLDYISVSFSPAVAKYEAESAERSGGAAVNKNHRFYSGEAFVDGMTAVGAQVKFNVDVPAAGNYQLALRYSNGTASARTLSTYVGGVDVAQISLPSTSGSWDKWQDAPLTVTLAAGSNTIAFRYDAADSGNVNLDRLLVSASPPGTPVSELNLLDNPGFERESAYGSNWTEWHPSGQALAYGVDSGSGSHPPASAWTGDKRAYFYSASAYEQSIHQVIDVPVTGAYYEFEARVRLQYANPTIARAEIAGYGGSMLTHDITNDGIWKYIKISNIYVTTGQIDVGFYVNSPGGTVLHIDDVRITRQ